VLTFQKFGLNGIEWHVVDKVCFVEMQSATTTKLWSEIQCQHIPRHILIAKVF